MILVCALLLVLTAMLGCLLDLSRILMAKSALRSRLEAAALAGVLQLDGTPDGLARARMAATEAVQAPQRSLRVEFASVAGDKFEQVPLDPAHARLVRVTATEVVPLTLVRLVVPQKDLGVWSSASAEQQAVRSLRHGLFPYSPAAHSTVAPHFGFQPGAVYTLRWPNTLPAGSGKVCEGDRTGPVVNSLQRPGALPSGFFELQSRAQVREAILASGQSSPHAINEVLTMTEGALPFEAATIVERIRSDTDQLSPTYAGYMALQKGNGQRIVAVPVHSLFPERTILQFAAFFLLPAAEYTDAADRPFCAEYVGPYLQGSRWKGVGEAGYLVAAVLP